MCGTYAAFFQQQEFDSCERSRAHDFVLYEEEDWAI